MKRQTKAGATRLAKDKKVPARKINLTRPNNGSAKRAAVEKPRFKVWRLLHDISELLSECLNDYDDKNIIIKGLYNLLDKF